MSNLAPPTVVKGFETRYVTARHVVDVNGSSVTRTVSEPRDYVLLHAPGQDQRAVTPMMIKEFEKVREPEDPINDQAAVQMCMLRDYIMPQYKAWKEGQEFPEHGTALAAWHQLTEHQITAITAAGVKTVEELIEAPDTVIERINLPGRRNLPAQARKWLEMRDVEVVAETMRERDAKVAELESDNAQMREQLAQLMAMMEEQTEPEDDAPKKRGRKPLPRDEDGNIIRDEAAA